MKFIFLALSATFFISTNLVAQQDITYHSEFEKEILNSYLSAKNASTLDLHLIADPTISINSVTDLRLKYKDILAELEDKQQSSKSEVRFLSWLYYRVHRKYLKEYSSHSSLASVLKNGKYDCLSATSLYSLLLNDLGYNVTVVETNYHIYLQLQTASGKYLFEATDPINGFVSNTHEIDERLLAYENELQVAEMNEDTYEFTSDFNAEVDIIKLTGLHYYNQAVKRYNNKELLETLTLLEKSTLFYNSDRIIEFGWVLANAIRNDSSIDTDSKVFSLNKISYFLQANQKMAVR